MKKLLSVILTICLVLATVPLGAFTFAASAATEYIEGCYTYTVSNGEATITDVDVSIFGDVIIPSNLRGYPVTSIGESAFSSCIDLTNIVVPDSVRIIGDYAFYGCNSLESMTLPFIGSSRTFNNSSNDLLGYIFGRDRNKSDSSTKQLGYYFFIPESLKSITITDATGIGNGAFYNCKNLTSITINDGVTSIGEEAFYNCAGLTDITISDSVTNIGYGAFHGCNSLESLTVPFIGSSREANKTYDSVLGYFFEHEGTTYDKGTIKQEFAPASSYSSASYYYYCIPLTLKSVTITDATQIPYGAFYNCENLTSITINDDVTSIGDRAFYQCKGITDMVVPNNVKTIGMAAFSGCTSLESITLFDKVTSIGESAFDYRCEKLTDVWYSGTVDDRADISIGTYGNDELINATWHYETCKGASTHTYDNSCDTICNVCEHIRTKIVHIYDNDCDTSCNTCGATRTTEHGYSEWIIDLEPTCVVAGSKHKECAVCGDVVNESIAATGKHNYVGVKTEPTCTAQGYTTYTCDMCNDCYVSDYVDDNGHSYDDEFDAFCNECNAERDAKKHGDSNGDGNINNRDLAIIMQYINGWNVNIDINAADVYDDGEINNKDYALLMRYINGWDVELQ